MRQKWQRNLDAMFFHFQSIIYAVAFLLGLEMVAFSQSSIFYVVAILLLVALGGAKNVGGRWIFSIVPAVFVFSSGAFLYLIDPPVGKQIFILLSTVMFYLSLLGVQRLNDYMKDQTARGMVIAAAAATLFFFYTASYGIYLNFMVSLWVLMAAYLIATTIISYQCFRIIKQNNDRLSWSYSIVLGMVMAEFAWVMNFWPFGYLTTGVVTLIFYYVLWDLAQGYFLDILSKKRVVANMLLFSVLIALVLASSRWLPAV